MAEIIENHTNIIPEIKEENTFNETASEQQKNVWDVCNGTTVKTENPNDTDILVHTNEPVVDLPKSTITPEKNEKQDANGGLVLSGSKSIAADKTITSQPESQTLNQNDSITVPCQVLHELIDKIVVKSTESNGAQIETQLPNNHCEGTPTAAGPDKVDNNPAEVKSQRFPKRKRVPKKSQDIDECRKEVQKPSLPLDIKPKIPAIETPIIWNSADLVWAYVAGHPLWPCMITTDPIENLFTKMRGSGRAVRLYHVQFLGDSPERGWVTEQRIFSYYSPDDYEKIINEMIVKQRKLMKKTPKMEVPARLRPLWNSAIEEIAEAVPFTPDERIANFKYNFKPYTKILQKLPFKEEADNIDGSKQEKHKTPVKRLQTPKSNKSPADPLRGVKKSAGTKLSKSAKSVLLNATNQSDVNSNTKNALFNAYCRKHKPAVSAQNPQLTPEQVEALIWMEWEALSPEEQQKCIPDDPVVDPSSPQGKRKGRPPKKSLEPTDVVNPHRCGSCSASYLTAQSLGQHKRWCAGVAALKGVPLGKGSRKSTESLSPVKQMVNELLICSKCKESFHDKRSLAIHKKFCSAVEPVGKSPKPPKPTASPLPRKKSAPHDDSSSNGSKADSEEAPSFKRTRVRGPQLGSNIKRENLCLICNGSSEDEELIHCIGGCCQSFHPGCLEDKVSSVADFTCKHCKDDNHACFICKKNSSVETQLGEVKRCTVLKCGRSYHSECLIAWKTSLLHLDDEDDDTEKEKERQAMINSSKCTLHQCGTCTTKEKEDTNNVANPSRCKLFRCIKCPTAFHIGDECIAAGSIMLPGLNIICPDHFEPLKTTPHHQPVHVSWCFVCSKGGELMCCETCPASFHPICVGLDKTPDDEWFCRDCRNKKRPLYGEIVWVKLGSYRWWPGEITHPNEIPDNIQRLQHGIGEFVVRFFGSNDYFWLNKRRVFAYQEGDTGATSSNCSRGISSVFNKALQEAQESFEELVSRQQKIQDVKQQKKRPVYKHIKVNRPIGSVQIYTAELSEIPRCICKKTDPNPCGPESECLNRMLMYECHADLCPAGDKCQNQHFQKRDYPQSEVFKTTWGGWALKAKTLIKKGEFVSEYVGELVDGEECMRRIEHAHKNNVTNFYMLTIDKDRIIDAGPKGNYSRFMNHCCDPNCETQKWTVNGDTRVGLFALGEIAAGEELTFNYNLDCLGNDKTPCMCGSSNCSGFIGVRPKPQLGENGNGNNKSVKRKRRRNESKNLPKHDDFCFRCRQVGTLVCCDVRACQRAFCLACLRLTKPPFGKWQCPWHHCDFCGRRAQHFCHFCPNSFCASHVNNQLVPSVPNNYDCCTDHNPNVAEYEMEEAIASICASMLGPDDSAELDEDPETPPSPPEVSTPQKKKISTPKSTPVSTPGGSGAKKRGRPRKYKTDGDPSVEITSTPTKVEPMYSDANTESDGSDDDDLGPPTESPVRIKRIKRSYYTGRHKRKRRCSNPETPKAKTNESLPKNADVSPLKSAVSTPHKNVLDKSGKMYTEL